jgi:hypothetical protein
MTFCAKYVVKKVRRHKNRSFALTQKNGCRSPAAHFYGKRVFRPRGLKTLNSSTLADFPLPIRMSRSGLLPVGRQTRNSIPPGFLKRRCMTVTEDVTAGPRPVAASIEQQRPSPLRRRLDFTYVRYIGTYGRECASHSYFLAVGGNTPFRRRYIAASA